MLPTLEDLVRSAKESGSAVGDGILVIYYDFGKTLTSGTPGVKKVGLSVPANSLIESGFLHAVTATTGSFAPQIVTSGDVLPSQSALAIGTTVDVARVSTGSLNREFLLNVASTATGKILIFLNIFPVA
jgi:hypothetical protein